MLSSKPAAYTIAVAAAFSASAANATDQGRWLCPECTIDGFKSGQTIPAADDTIGFITYTVNPQLFPQTPGVTAPRSGWLGGDVITICNGALCQKLTYYPSGVFLAVGGSYKDSRAPYRNSGSRNVQFSVLTPTACVSPGNIFNVSYQQYATDYYSDGKYVGTIMDNIIVEVDYAGSTC